MIYNLARNNHPKERWIESSSIVLQVHGRHQRLFVSDGTASTTEKIQNV